jgi:hypothetical protein
MEIEINKNIRLWQEFNPFESSWLSGSIGFSNYGFYHSNFRINKMRVAIKNRWFDVLTPSELVRKRNINDGYYRVVYIQTNMENGEYYIGKANRPKWSELKRYHGSGLKFAAKYKKYHDQFVRFYIAACETAAETEQLEASIVDNDLLSDEKCLNLIAGGGGTTKRSSVAESSEKKRQHMKNHPEQFQSMIDASKKAFQSGDTPALRARNKRIKEVMSLEKYREMSRIRIAKWKDENPEEYAKARNNNLESIKSPESQEKRKASLSKWKMDNPDKHQAWEANRIDACSSEKANEKRKASLKEWREQNPVQAMENAQKRAAAATAKLSKEVCMLNLQSGQVLKTFSSQHAAAKWLVENNKAKNLNCVSSISSVCLRKPCSTGYGYRKKAYGYDWRFKSEIETKE